jgi:hypothetical protein
MTNSPAKYFLRRAQAAPLALAFTLLLGLFAPFGGGVHAQTALPAGKGQYVAPENSPAFIVYQSPDGEVACRDATPEEAGALGRRATVKLHQINHLEEVTVAPDGSVHLNSSVNAVTSGMTIVLRATSQLEANPAAKQAFINAAAKWEALIADPITVVLDVDFGPTHFGTAFSSSNILGATSTQNLFSNNNYASVRQRLVSHAPAGSEEASVLSNLPASSLPTDIGNVTTLLVASPILRALGMINAVADPNTETNFGPPPAIGFNSAFGFDFDPTNGVTATQTDFDSVAVHEIGHALGFNSEGGAHELQPTRQLFATVWDLYRFRPGTTTNANFSTAQRVLSSGTDSLDRRVQFNGNTEVALSTGKPDGTGGDGNQSSHWKDDGLGVPFIGIMDPSIRRGVHEQITVNDQRAIDFFGYSIGQVTVTPPPANDNFASAQQLSSSTSERVTGTNAGATKEAGEPSHSPDGNPGGKSVWYRWQAPASGTTTLSTGNIGLGAASDFDTVLGVYTGASVNALTAIVKNDDIDSPGGVVASTVTFNAVAGTTYQIAVDGYAADEGNIALSWNMVVTPPIGTTVQFAVATQAASETNGSAQVIVTRSGGSATTSSVDVRTNDNPAAVRCDDTTTMPGVAFARCDYATTIDTLTFAPGETTKTINVPLIDDAYGEPDESVALTLANPVGASLGTQSSTTLVINSNEAVGQTSTVNPIFSTPFFVRMQYLDFLSREPDAGGFNAYVNLLNGCADVNNVDPNSPSAGCDRIAVSTAFFGSQEFQLKGLYVFRFYKVAFNRLPQYTEIVADMRSVTGSTAAAVFAKKAAYASAFVQRAEFTSAYNAQSNSSYVQALLQRYNTQTITTIDPVNPDGTTKVTLSATDLTNALNNSTLTRAQVLRAVADSDQVFVAEYNQAFVAMQYYGYLRRTPDTAGYNAWLNYLNTHPTDSRTMVNGFMNSPEYRLRFGQQ